MTKSDLIRHGTRLLGQLWVPGVARASYRHYNDGHGDRGQPDGRVSLLVDGAAFEFDVVARRQLNTAGAASISAQAGESTSDLLVVSEKVTAAVASVLREHGISYLDAAGNAHIERPPLLVHVEGKRPVQAEDPVRAFAGEGLKTVFVLLLDPGLASESYRSLAELSGVSHGVVQYTVKGLETSGYLMRLGRTERRLTGVGALLDRWAAGYTETMRPKITRGRFAFTGERAEASVRDWRSIVLPKTDRWGGEPAADLATGHLHPAHLTVYTRQAPPSLMKALRAVPSPGGPLTVLTTFWPEETEAKVPEAFGDRSVPDVLTYADLLASGDPRNATVAAQLRDQIVTRSPYG